MFSSKWLYKDQANFLTNVGLCLEKGYTLAASIRLQSFQKHGRIQISVDKLLEELSRGQAIADVLYNNGFSRDACSYLYFSEKKGDLAQGFQESGRLLAFREKQKKALDRVLHYPLFLLWLFGVMFYVTINHLLPSFQQIYASMNLPQPTIVKYLLVVSGHFYTLLFIFLFSAFSLIFLSYLFQKYCSQETKMNLYIRIPVISSYVKMYLTYLFAHHFGGLLRIGMSINEALSMMGEQHYQQFFREEAGSLKQVLTSGSKLEDIIIARPFYLKELASVIANGNIYGQLGLILSDYSVLILSNMEFKLKRSMGMIQPTFFILFGGLIILLFLSIMLPIFHMMDGL